MADYTKPWLSIDEQITKLAECGTVVSDRAAAHDLLRTIGYYRLTGYLYPFDGPRRTPMPAAGSAAV